MAEFSIKFMVLILVLIALTILLVTVDGVPNGKMEIKNPKFDILRKSAVSTKKPIVPMKGPNGKLIKRQVRIAKAKINMLEHKPVTTVQMKSENSEEKVARVSDFSSKSWVDYRAISAKAAALRTKRARTFKQEHLQMGEYVPVARETSYQMTMPSNNNYFTQRFERTVMPMVYRSPVENYYMPQQTYMHTLPSASTAQERIIIPVGTSYYQPIQYVDNYSAPPPLDISYLRKMDFGPAPTYPNMSANEFFKRYDANNNNNNKAESRPATMDSKVSESTTHPVTASANETSKNPVETLKIPQTATNHPMRTIELESRAYAPLTIRFPPIPTQFNIITPMENDLVGQDSLQHDSSFGRRTTTTSANNNNNNDANTGSSYVRNLDTRMIFGNDVVEEPLVLKTGTKPSSIPPNMQRIIKCVFPDFKFDGDDKVESAC